MVGSPSLGFLGSSNLTLAGLSRQGELNVDVLDHDATEKLAQWFNDRWDDRWCIEITPELIQVLDESWARLEGLPRYQIYVKMAYHLAEEARAGLSEFNLPADMRGVLLEFQSAAVRIAARHLEKRGGVILGDVVGLGKTLMATALARVFQYPPRSLETLILCPKNLVGMWEDYAHRHRLTAKVVPVTQAQNILPELRRYRVTIIDESHNLRNRESRRWAVVRDYIARNEEILCYSFLPADGVERLIRLRARVRQRLHENAEVVGTDETFFEDETHDGLLRDLFTEKSGILDDPEDNEVDLASLAYQIWKNACDTDPSLKKTIPDLASVVFSTKALSAVPPKPAGAAGVKPDSGVMVYVRTADGNDALAWVDEQGRTVTESQHEILRAAACEPTTPALPRLASHHTLVQQAVAGIQQEHASTGGQLGKPASARRRVYERLKEYAAQVKDSLFYIKPLHQAIDALYETPLTEAARDLLNREMKSGIESDKLVELVLSLHEEDRLCIPPDDAEAREPKIICSLGIRKD